MSSAWHVEHQDGTKEIVWSLAEAIKKLVEISENEEFGTVKWSS